MNTNALTKCAIEKGWCGVLRVEYPCFSSGEPMRLPAKEVGKVAENLRQALFGARPARPLDVEALTKRAKAVRVNGRNLRIAWDSSQPVHDEAKKPVLGVCEHDPDAPGTVLISLNAKLLKNQPELMRSTAAHELGHAIFDMPAAIDRGAARVFRSQVERSAKMDWREWRADEFMGAFLAPKRQLARAFIREASARNLKLRWHVDGIPLPRVRESEAGEATDEITGALAEEFGLTDSFIAVRLGKYGFIEI